MTNRLIAAITMLIIFTSVIVFGDSKTTDSITITLVLWRGITAAEQGFMNEFKNDEVRFTILDCQKKTERLAEFRDNLNQNPPDLIYAFGTTVTLVLAGRYDNWRQDRYIKTTPIVFSVVADAAGAGILAPSTNMSGRNITGVSHIVPMEMQIKAMRSILPVRSIAALYNPREENAVLQIRSIAASSIQDSLDPIIVPLPVSNDGKVTDADLQLCMRKIISQRPDVLYLPSDSYIISNAEKIITRFHSEGIPTVSATEEPIKNSGAFMGLVSRYSNVGAFAAHKAKQILFNKTNVGSIPCERLSKYSLQVNISAARTLSRYPPVNVLRFAEIITTDPSLELK